MANTEAGYKPKRPSAVCEPSLTEPLF